MVAMPERAQGGNPTPTFGDKTNKTAPHFRTYRSCPQTRSIKHQRKQFGGPNWIRTRVWALPRFRRRYHAVGSCLVHERGDRPQTCRSIRPLKLAASCLTRLESVRSGATRSDRTQTCRPRMARRQFSATWVVTTQHRSPHEKTARERRDAFLV